MNFTFKTVQDLSMFIDQIFDMDYYLKQTDYGTLHV